MNISISHMSHYADKKVVVGANFLNALNKFDNFFSRHNNIFCNDIRF